MIACMNLNWFHRRFDLFHVIYLLCIETVYFILNVLCIVTPLYRDRDNGIMLVKESAQIHVCDGKLLCAEVMKFLSINMVALQNIETIIGN